MLIPAHVYKHLPLFWLLVGLVCIGAAVYLGFDYAHSVWYFGVGWFCVIWSTAVFVMRSRNRSDPTPSETVEDEQPG